MNAKMARAYQILHTFSDEELRGFLLLFGSRLKDSGNTTTDHAPTDTENDPVADVT